MYADPSLTQRKSFDTSDHYLMIFDHHPEMTKFPKRSRSFICTLSEYKASRYGEVFVVIPVDGVKLGVLNNKDMWNIKINMLGTDLLESSVAAQDGSIVSWNLIFKTLGFNDTNWDMFKKQTSKPVSSLANKLASVIKKLFDITLKSSELQDSAFFFNHIIDAYSPSKTGFTCATTDTFKANLKKKIFIGTQYIKGFTQP